jgi:hypothetical protein
VALITVEKFEKPDRVHSVFQLFARLLYRKLGNAGRERSRTKVATTLLEIAKIRRGKHLYNFASLLASALLASSMFSNGR